jgi:hypothetical protein
MKRRNQGQILVLFVLALVVLIGLAALGVDIGYWYSVRHELQRSADTGALAGASYFKETGYWSDVSGDPNMAIADARARIFATRDNVITSHLDNTEVFVSFPEHFKIRVGTERTVPLFFARLFLGPTKTIHAYAVAEAFPVTQNVKCIVPWGFPAPWNDVNNNGIFDADAGDTFTYPTPDDEAGWAAYKAEHCDVLTGNTVWNQANHVISVPSDRDDWLCNGSLQVLKLTPGSTDNTTTERVPGNFYGMDFFNIVDSCPGIEKTHGADFYSYLIKSSCDCNFKTSEADILNGAPLDTKTGNMVGPTISPVAPDKYYAPPIGEYYLPDEAKALPADWRDVESVMNGDPNSQWVDDLSGTSGGHPSSSDYPWTADGTVPDGAQGPWWKSPRIIKLPIYSPDPNYPYNEESGLYTPEKGGKTSFKPLGFVGFWVQDIQYFNSTNGTIVGRFVTVPGEGTGTEPGPAGTQVLNIRLVE